CCFRAGTQFRAAWRQSGELGVWPFRASAGAASGGDQRPASIGFLLLSEGLRGTTLKPDFITAMEAWWRGCDAPQAWSARPCNMANASIRLRGGGGTVARMSGG